MKDDVKLAKWLEGTMDEGELREFKAAPEYNIYAKIADYSATLVAPEADTDGMYQNIKSQKTNTSKVIRFTPWLYKVAAIVVLVLGASFFFYATNTTTQIADAGEHKEFLLPDNSEVVLNAGSEANFKSWNWNNNRKVNLDGEAYFKVAKGQKFDVVTTMGTVTVVGTQFNVKARDNRFDVTCFEGKVKVSSNDKEIMLTPGQGVSFANGKQIAASPAAGNIKPGWVTYEVHFNDEKLANVIAEMERQYNIVITLPEGDYSPFSGPLPMNDLDTALDNIITIYNLQLVKADGKIILNPE